MVDCLTLCNTSCITCIWCLFPKHFNNFDDTDSNKCTFKPIPKPKPFKGNFKRSCKVKDCKLRRRPRSADFSANCTNKQNGNGHREKDQLIWSAYRKKCEISVFIISLLITFESLLMKCSRDGNLRKLAPCESRHTSGEVKNGKYKLSMQQQQ
ncbi:hypothetical protein TSAR_007437 [Trichomalopsis sarcophagae]|uniref:Uncharacterized protein n=1 Tax=Trichomalopsis sarcophagae TaxID=543379 RepID=A0A232FE39_9HYME|nr:hypothetical protein TSAR_007437 [Trichomalopsis sarcophagae]